MPNWDILMVNLTRSYCFCTELSSSAAFRTPRDKKNQANKQATTFPPSVSFLTASLQSARMFTHLFPVFFSSAAFSCSVPYSTGWAKFACKYSLCSVSVAVSLVLISSSTLFLFLYLHLHCVHC